MPTLLLTFCLLLSGGNSRAGRLNIPAPLSPSQSEAVDLNRLLEQADACDEPTLRILLRLKIAAYLWDSESDSVKAEAVAEKVVADLNAHEKEIPTLYLRLFRRELLAKLKLHAPEMAARLTEDNKPDSRTEFQVAYSMLKQEGGADKAVGIVRSGITAGNYPGPIVVSFLHQLETVRPGEVPRLLDILISEEESRPGFIPAASLFTLKHLYIREQTPQGLQRRYLIAVINRANGAEASSPSVADIYTTLANALPAVEKQAPDLYASASARLSQLGTSMPRAVLERISVDGRVSQSADPLSQLLVEVEAAKDQTLREDLLTRAAQLALEKRQPHLAIKLVVKLQPKNDKVRLWRDQFIEEAVGGALEKKDLEAARYGAGQIQSAFVRSSALQKIALHLQATEDLVGARDTLTSALKSIETVDDSADKAAALLELASLYVKVDKHRVRDLVRSAIKTINKVSAVSREVGVAGNVHAADVENTMKIVYRIIPLFQALSATDRDDALDLAKGIQSQGLRAAANFGAYTGTSAPGNTKQGLAAK